MDLPFKVKRIDHVAVCVGDGDAAAQRLGDLLGLVTAHDERVAAQKVRALFLGVPADADGAEVELIVPEGNEGVERFLEKRGPGLHHVAFEVEGIEAALAWLKQRGVPLVDEAPRPGARGHKVAFLHPKGTGGVLVELVEKPE